MAAIHAGWRWLAAGVPPQQIYGGKWFTFTESEQFFSYRREGITGRMATVVGLR